MLFDTVENLTLKAADVANTSDHNSADSFARTMTGHFDRWSDYWENVYSGDSFISRHMNDRKNIVLSLVNQVSAGRQLNILDLGCGAGVLTQALLEKGHAVTAVDSSPVMLARLTALLEGGQPKYPRFNGAIQALATDTGLQDRQFDLVVCIGVMQYHQNDQSLLKEIFRILKNDGTCILSLPNLMTVNHLSDPYYLLSACRALWTRCIRKTDNYVGLNGAFRFVGKKDDASFYNKKYLPWEIQAPIRQHGLVLQKRIGYGFGPLTFWEREFLPDKFSIIVSDAVTRLAQKFPFRWLAAFANRWVFQLHKPLLPTTK